MNQYHINVARTEELYVCYYGEDACQPGHQFGPFVRDEYLIHYILKGKGTYIIEGQAFELSAHQGFLIQPNELTTYRADEVDPWHYIWIGFDGTLAKSLLEQGNLSTQTPIFTYNKDQALINIHKNLMAINMFDLGKDSLILGYLYQWLGHIMSTNGTRDENKNNTSNQDIYFKEALSYIHQHYYKDINIYTLSDYLGIDRTYLFQIFKNQIHKAPSDYLITYRLKKAAELLLKTDLPINQIAEAVGYKDPLTFSKAFKKRHGVSPKQYRIT